MKWKTKAVEPIPQIGDKRQRKIFAFRTHHCVDGYTRWLEDILIDEEFITEAVGPMGAPYEIQYWKEIASHPVPYEPVYFDGSL